MRDQYIRKSEGFIIIYSITSRATFDALNSWRDTVSVQQKEREKAVIGHHCCSSLFIPSHVFILTHTLLLFRTDPTNEGRRQGTYGAGGL